MMPQAFNALQHSMWGFILVLKMLHLGFTNALTNAPIVYMLIVYLAA
jgi:hypothetical protein